MNISRHHGTSVFTESICVRVQCVTVCGSVKVTEDKLRSPWHDPATHIQESVIRIFSREQMICWFCSVTHLSSSGTRCHQAILTTLFLQSVGHGGHQSTAGGRKRMSKRQRTSPWVKLLHRRSTNLRKQKQCAWAFIIIDIINIIMKREARFATNYFTALHLGGENNQLISKNGLILTNLIKQSSKISYIFFKW